MPLKTNCGFAISSRFVQTVYVAETQGLNNRIALGTHCVKCVLLVASPQVTENASMPNCYVCGRPLNESRYRLRRKVQTGEWVRRVYRRGGGMTVAKRYGSRVVCRGCASRLDMRNLQSERWQKIQLVFWLSILLILVLVRWAEP